MVSDTLIALDHDVFGAIHHFYGRSPAFDDFVWLISSNYLFKGVVSAMIFWWLWFKPHPQLAEVRSKLTSLLLLSVLAIFLGRLLALELPFRNRPFLHPELIRWSQERLSNQRLDDWSSMPSDHAVLYFALATGFLMIDRSAGILALLHAVFMVSLVRVYIGMHFPGDILVGALVGTAAAVLLLRPFRELIRVVSRQLGLSDLSVRQPELFYPLLFFVTLQFATMFDPARSFARSMAEIFRSVAG